MANYKKPRTRASKKEEHTTYATEETFESLDHTAQRAEGFLEKNAKILGYAFGALVLAAVGYFAYLRFYQEPRNQEATNEISQADTYFKQDSMALAVNGSPGAFMGFNEITEDFSGTDVANLAKYKAAIALYQTGDYQAALDKFNSFDADEEALAAMKKGGMGDAYVQLGQKEKGLDAYEEAVNASDLEVLEKIFTKKAAVLALDLGQNERGLKTLELFNKKYPDASDLELEKLTARLQYLVQP